MKLLILISLVSFNLLDLFTIARGEEYKSSAIYSRQMTSEEIEMIQSIKDNRKYTLLSESFPITDQPGRLRREITIYTDDYVSLSLLKTALHNSAMDLLGQYPGTTCIRSQAGNKLLYDNNILAYYEYSTDGKGWSGEENDLYSYYYLFKSGDIAPTDIQYYQTMAGVLDASPTRNISGINYKIFHEDIHDSPIKSQITQKIIVYGDINSYSLEQMLLGIYNELKIRTEFTYHKYPTHIFIYAYTDQDRAKSGSSWIAMLDKIGDIPAEVSIKKNQINQLSVPATKKFGLLDKDRIRVYQEYYKLEGEAMNKVQKRYPLKEGDPEGTNSILLQKQAQLLESLTKQFRNYLANRYALTLNELDQIIFEGINKDWPAVAYDPLND